MCISYWSSDVCSSDLCDAVMIDLHGEASSEKMAFGHAFDGRVSMVVGTHTHVPTADTMVLANGTAYQTDAGMCGDYDSVIGMKKEVPVDRFTRKLPTPRLEAADRSEEHTSELQSLMSNSYAVF